MKRAGSWVAVAGIGFGAMFAAQPGCAPTKTGNPVVTLSFDSYTTASWLPFINDAYAAVSEAKFCFKRLRFKQTGETSAADPTTDEDNVDFSIGQVTLKGDGTLLGSVEVPEGTYVRIEFDLEKDCNDTIAPSVSVTNDSSPGVPYESEDRVTIKFEGTFTASAAQHNLALGVQSLVTALDGVTDGADIKAALEAASGDF